MVKLTLLLLLLGGGRSSSVTGSGGGTSSGSGSGVSVRVGNAVLELVDGLPLVVDLNGGRDDVLVRVDNGVHDRRQGGVVGGQGDGGNGGDGAGESLEELALLNVEDARVEGLALVIDLSNTHTVGEGRDVQHVEQGSLGSSDLAAGLDELQVSGNFDGTTGNLGRNTESLEERGLSGFHTSVTSGDENVGRGNGTGTGRGGDTVGENLLTGVLEVGVGEDETDVACERACGQSPVSRGRMAWHRTHP